MATLSWKERLSRFWRKLRARTLDSGAITMDSSVRNMLDHVPTYQPVQIGDYYKPGWWVNLPKSEQMTYIHNLGIADLDFQEKTFLEVGCAEGFACFYAEQQGASYVLATDGGGWKYGTRDSDPWSNSHPQNMMLVFELQKMLKQSQVVRMVIDVESPDFVDSVQRLGITKYDVVLCAGVIYHNYNPVLAMRNIYLVTGELAVFQIPDFRDLQKDGRAFTPFPNRPVENDFNYSQVLKYGQSNNRFWNLSPEEWASMLEFVGFSKVELEEREGRATAFYCHV